MARWYAILFPVLTPVAAAADKTKKFTFDFSYDSFVPRDNEKYASQDHVWKDIGVGVLNNAYEGYNCSLFAYGQTGAGKSYSMMGYGEDKGIIPIASERIFNRINSNEDPNITYRVETSMLEIYMEKVRDLFNPKRGENLKIRNHPKRGYACRQRRCLLLLSRRVPLTVAVHYAFQVLRGKPDEERRG